MAETTVQYIRNLIANPFGDCDLTDREREALGLAARGIGAKVIADQMGISKAYVYRLFDQAIPKVQARIGRKEIKVKDLPALLIREIEEAVQ